MTDPAARESRPDVERRLRAAVAGEVGFDAGARALYSADASNHRRVPLGVVWPRTTEDVVAAVGACRDAGVPVTLRGGGTSVAGNAIGPGVVLDTSRHLCRIEVDAGSRRARVQPGVVLDRLREAAAPHGLTFGPDPSSRSRCTVGGMLGNDACGAHSVAWGTTADSVASLDVLLADGTRMTVGEGRPDAGGIHAQVRDLVAANLATIRTRFGRFGRQLSGYPLHRLLPERGAHLARALVGTEGTCVTVLDATLDLVPVPAARALVVVGFADVYAAAEAAPALVARRPLTVEGIDAALLDALHARGRRVGVELPTGRAWLLLEVGGATAGDALAAARRLAADLPGPARAVGDAAEQRALWRVRDEGAGLATRRADGAEAWPGWEDAAVPPERLASYLREFADLTGRYGLRGVTYGHFGEGCIHVRLDFDLVSAPGRDRYAAFLHDAADLVVRHGGSPSGEHGDGLARSALLPRLYGDDGVALLAAFKRIWDPDGLLNPGVVVDPPPVDTGIRVAYSPAVVASGGFGYPEDGGDFGRAVRRCVGVGKCRDTGGGVMCPSWQVTADEKHSTRGRARLLLEMLRGETIADGWRSSEVAEALDLCFACKGCLSDCPVNVDMATYKAEFLYHRYRGRPRPSSHYAMGWLPLLGMAASRAPGLVDAAGRGRATGAVVRRVAGMAPERTPPRFAAPTFRRWWRRRPVSARGREVVLWPDTFTDRFAPWIGAAAVAVLEAAGFSVRVPRGALCCGLTWISTGQLGVARRVGRHTLAALAPFVEAGVPVVGLEPSCLAVFRHDLPRLLPDDRRAAALARASVTLAELLGEAREFEPPTLDRDALVQTHCHQHAVLGFAADRRLLEAAGVRAQVLDSGCCGMAGNFGFERGHYEVSTAAAERVLFPAVRAAAPGTLVIADGFSCRTQVAQGVGRRAYHLAEVLAGRVGRLAGVPAGRHGGEQEEKP